MAFLKNLLFQTAITVVNKIKNPSYNRRRKKKERKEIKPHSLRPFTPFGIKWKKDGFGAEAEAWVGGAECQTSTADKHGSVSEGEGVGGDEGRERGDKGGEQEMRH